MRKILYILFLISISVNGQDTIRLTDADIRAFPFAEGKGKNATGGRGYSNVWLVNNQNTSGTGSVDWALRQTGGGFVLGIIDGYTRHSGDDYISMNSAAASNKTIEFVTAPNGNFEIQGAEVRITGGSNLIMRNARIRLGPTGSSDTNVDCLNLSTQDGPISNMSFDRLSLGLAIDEAFSTVGSFSGNAGITNITLSNSIIAHSGFGLLIFKETYGTSFIRNIGAHLRDRDFYSSTHQSSREVENNLIYGPGESFNVTAGETHDLRGNYFKLIRQVQIGASAASVYLRHSINTNNSPSQTLSDSEIYQDDNIFDTDNYVGSAFTSIIASSYSDNDRATPNFTTSDYYTHFPALQVLDTVLSTTAGAGATPWNRDPIDQDVIDDINSNSGNQITSPSYSNNSHFANFAFAQHPAGYDTDSDGLPNTYESLNGNPVSTDRFEYMTLPDGRVIDQSMVTADIRYTWLEGFLFDKNKDWDKFPTVSSPAPSEGKVIKSRGGRIGKYKIKN